MSKNKQVLIISHCGQKLTRVNESFGVNSPNESYILSGKFTTFDTRNRNNRVYEAKDFLPFIESLQEKIKNKMCFGEIEHPDRSNTPMNLASHIVESLEYDQQQNCIIGKVRLLSTPAGQIARALVNDGIPLHISSRASGTVDESGKVHLQQLFTYDLVADPGFANAVLNRLTESLGYEEQSQFSKKIKMINESYERASKAMLNEEYGITPSDDENNVYIYELPDEETNNVDVNVVNNKENTNQINNMENDNPTNGEFITSTEFKKYTSYLSKIITELSAAVVNYKDELDKLKTEKTDIESIPTSDYNSMPVDNSQIEDMIKSSAEIGKLEEKYNKLVNFTNYLSDNLDKAITHQDYLAENLENSINYQNYIVEECNKSQAYTDYVAENLDKAIAHQDYVVEECNKSQAYTDYVAENLDKAIAHQDYVVEECNKSQAYTDYVAENLDKAIAHQDYLAENLDNSINYQNYITEGLNKIESTAKSAINDLSESFNMLREHSNYVVECLNTDSKEATQQIVESKVREVKTNFAGVDEICNKLDAILETAKQNAQAKKEAEEQQIVESQKTQEATYQNTLVEYIPTYLKESWKGLSDARKTEILNESKLYVIDTQLKAEQFWKNRDLREKQVNAEVLKINETNKKSTLSAELSVYAAQVSHNMKYNR